MRPGGRTSMRGALGRWSACASMRGGTRIVARFESTEAEVETGTGPLKAVITMAEISKMNTSQKGY